MKTMLALLFGLSSAALAAADAPPAADPAAIKPYPLETCIVTNEPLGSMGDPVVHVHEGQEVKFCCKGCVKKFTKDPAKFLIKLEQAPAATPAKPAEAAKPADHAHPHAH